MELNWVKVLGGDGQDKLHVCDLRRLRRIDYADGKQKWIARIATTGGADEEQFFDSEAAALEAIGYKG